MTRALLVIAALLTGACIEPKCCKGAFCVCEDGGYEPAPPCTSSCSGWPLGAHCAENKACVCESECTHGPPGVWCFPDVQVWYCAPDLGAPDMAPLDASASVDMVEVSPDDMGDSDGGAHD